MVVNERAHQVCENILKTIKSSKLNYVFNETPYSSYITIRKAFTKEHRELSNVTLVREDELNHESFKENISALEVKCKIMKEELEVSEKVKRDLDKKLERYVTENVNLTQDLFILKGELATQCDSSKQGKETIFNMERNNQSLNDKLIKVSNKVDELKKQTVEKEDLIEILHKTVEHKTIEVRNLGSS